MYAASRPKGNSETFSTSMYPSGTARQGGYRRHFGGSLPGGFPTQILYTRWTLFSNLFFFFCCIRFLTVFLFSSSLVDVVSMSDPESVAALSDKFIVDYLNHLEVMEIKKKKRAEERAKESQKTKEKVYNDRLCSERSV